MSKAAPEPLLETKGLIRHFPIRGFMGRRIGTIRAVDDITLMLNKGEALGIVGESGCGKSTLGKTLAGIHEPTSGTISLAGTQIAAPGVKRANSTRALLQYVHQDLGASLDPRWTLGSSLHEPLIVHTGLSRRQRAAKIRDLVAALGLSETILDHYPHEISGGQLRRLGLARILLLNPPVVIFDEPTASLDASVKATVVALLKGLHRTFDLTSILITHDINVARSTCDRIAVMYLGKIVEVGPTEQITKSPRHPYTRSLMAALPRIGGPRVTETFSLQGAPPSASNIPSGCRFRLRCSYAIEICTQNQPDLIFENGSGVACLRTNDPALTQPATG